jgi:transglutaminase-like putative cysteine protease
VRWSVSHETVYRYSVPVTFAPHLLRLSPRSDKVRVIRRALNIEPTPDDVYEYADSLGNTCTRAAFGSGASTVLAFRSDFEVETFVAPSLELHHLPALPWTGAPDDELAPFRRFQPVGATGSDGPGAEVMAFARGVADAAGWAPIGFLDHLCQTLSARIDKTIRLDGAAQQAGETLAVSRGACRDITVLFLAACRVMGIAGRFVSGYQGVADTLDGRRHLHAWPDVFVPGAGWQGWDPMHGVRVSDHHISLCVAPSQDGTMPVEGGFYFHGPLVNSTLDYAIRIERSG